MTITPTAASAAMEATLSEQVAEEIRALLGRRRMSGRQLAAAMDVSPSWINYRLTGRQPIDLNDLYRIARALGIPVLELFPSDLRRAVRLTYPVPAGDSSKPTNRWVSSVTRSGPPTFGQRSSQRGHNSIGRKINTRPPGHPMTDLRRAA